ncbi:hypothetical protein K439DRAFT_1190177 [Ramaria rubella]|nr:hypothetical protein K439DRAFT_1190177 [Ramaria rubella]
MAMSTSETKTEPCISCRIISTAVLLGVGTHALRYSRPTAPGSPAGRRVLGVMGVGE